LKKCNRQEKSHTLQYYKGFSIFMDFQVPLRGI
jgi:hypothetical protein